MTREQWLNAFAAHPVTRDVFAEAGAPLPTNIRMSVGFSSKGAKSSTIGQCWSDACSADAHFEIFIVPGLGDASRVADVLTHELIHAAVGLEAKHGRPFKRVMKAVGLEGKATATTAGADWHAWADEVLADIGPFPHAALATGAGGSSAPKAQKNRMVKCECTECGFVFRAARSWIEKAEELRCPDPECGGIANPEIGEE